MGARISPRQLAMVGRGLAAVAGMVLLTVVIGWLSGMFEHKEEPGWEPSGARRLEDQEWDTVHEVVQPYVEEAVGKLQAASRTLVSARILATIEAILVKSGDEVAPGQELVRLDRQEYESRLAQARQAEVKAKASLQQAKTDFERIDQLFARQAVAKSEHDAAQATLQVSQAEADRAHDAVTESEVLLSYTTIRADQAGRVVERFAEPGDTARPGEPILALYDASSLRLEAPVTEQLAVTLKPGDPVTVYVDALQRSLDATIDEVVPQADAPTRSFLVKASVPGLKNLYQGMFGRLRIPAGQRRHLCLATDAIIHLGQLEYVDVVLPDQTVERRLIKTGRLGQPGRQEVLSGLQPGERVILYPSSRHGEPPLQELPDQPRGAEAANSAVEPPREPR